MCHRRAPSPSKNPPIHTRPNDNAIFLSARSLHGRARQSAARSVPTAFSTAPNNAPESHEKPNSFHPQFTHNPQLVHRLPSGLHTLAVAKTHARPPKSSAAFSCPTPGTSIQVRRCDWLFGHSNWREPSSEPAETVTGAVTFPSSKLQSRESRGRCVVCQGDQVDEAHLR